jgi:hypothetical protein
MYITLIISFPIKKKIISENVFYIISENYFIRNLKWNVSFPGKIGYIYLNIPLTLARFHEPVATCSPRGGAVLMKVS